MKKLFLILFLAFSWQSNAQVTIGTGTVTDQGLPIEPYSNYSYSQVIYLQSEIRVSGDITTLTWDFDGGLFSSIDNSNDWTVYIGHTTKTEFSSSSDWVDVSTLTEVFTGTVTVDGDNKVVVDITDFAYNNTDNLVIAIDENESGYNLGSNDFNCSSVSGNRGIEYHSDNTNPNPASPPSGNTKAYIANIVLGGITSGSFHNPTDCRISLSIPDNGCGSSNYLEVPIQISNAPGNQLGTDVILSTASIIIEHSYDADLEIYLESPNGVIVELSTDNGGSGNDYGDLTNCPNDVTTFDMGASGYITEGTAPFIGSYIPEGDFNDFNDGSDPNGVWILKICDDANNDIGTVEFVELALVPPPCPDNLTVLPAGSSTTTSTASCVDGDWTHYYNGTNILLSLKLGSSDAVITDVTVDPAGSTDAQWFDNDADGFPEVSGQAGGAFMKRKWEVNASTQPSSDVGVRFYYTSDEFDAVNTVLSDNGGTELNGHNALEFYKVTSGEDPFAIGQGGIGQGDYILIKHGSVGSIDTWVDGTYGSEYYAEFNVAGFSGGSAGAGSAGLSIPIELLSFTGYVDKDANILKWTTLSENNTSMFYVEQSKFGKEWSVVAKVEASGYSLSKSDYQVVDKEPVTKAFYRLRSVDRDGKYTISKVITIERKETGLKLNAVFPNPSNGNFVVNLTSLPGEKGQIVMINALGVKVYIKDLDIKGRKTIEEINVNQLPNGVYTLMLEQNGNIITKRVVINK